MYNLEELTLINKALEHYLKYIQNQTQSTNEQINNIKLLIWKIQDKKQSEENYQQAVQTFDDMFYSTPFGKRQRGRR